MQLDKLAAEIRPRTPWEGVDLGFALAQRWYLRLWLLWWIGAAPVLLLSLLFLHNYPLWAIVVLWWFKPLYEPPLLHWLSRTLFGDPPPVRDMLRQWHRIVAPRLLHNLLWRRLSPNRSLYMPVAQLEGLKGKPRVERLRVLRGGQSAGGWLTIMGVHFEGILQVSFAMFLLMLVPAPLLEDGIWLIMQSDQLWLVWTGNLLALLAMSLFAPFYVAGGFGLYLSRRTALEAWDLELVFRRLRNRLENQARAVMLLLALLGGGLGLMPEAKAALTPDAARTIIEEVLADEDFGKTETVREWVYIGEHDTDTDADTSGWSGWFSEGTAALVEAALWIAAIGLALWFIYLAIRHRNRFRRPELPRRAPPTAVPKELFGLDLSPESLPEDVHQTVEELLRAREYRAALSLLYRATLAEMLHRHQLDIGSAATESECEALVSQAGPAQEAGFFQQLTRTWVRLAYGHLPPEEEDIHGLNQAWRLHFGQSDEN